MTYIHTYNHRYYTYKGLAMHDQNNSDVISNTRYGIYAPSSWLLDVQASSFLLCSTGSSLY